MKTFLSILGLLAALCGALACSGGGEIDISSPEEPFFVATGQDNKDQVLELAVILSGRVVPGDEHVRIARTVLGTTFWAGGNPYTAARVIRTESHGDSMAVSAVGAVGLGQIRPEVWLGVFPSCGNNLFRVRDNVCYTVHVLNYYMSHWPHREALLRYNGCRVGWGCEGYANRVMEN